VLERQCTVVACDDADALARLSASSSFLGLTGVLALAETTRGEPAVRARSPEEAVVSIRVVGALVVDHSEGSGEREERPAIELGTGTGFVVTTLGHVLTDLDTVRD